MKRDYAYFAAFLLTVPAANYAIGHWGTECIPNGPCVIPVGFGLSAPSGVLFVGAALVLRDIVQERLGLLVAAIAVVLGSLLSGLVASPSLALASILAFIVAEALDMVVYTPLRKKSVAVAVLASGLVGAVVDSVIFLLVAFGSLAFIEGQIVGKLWVSLVVAAYFYARNARVPK